MEDDFPGPFDDSLEQEFGILERLAQIANASAPAADLGARLLELHARGARPTHDEFLTAYRAVRDERLVPPEAIFYLIAHQLIQIAEERQESDPRLRDISDQIDKIQRAHGLSEDQYWPLGEGPDDYQALSARWSQISDGIIAETFRAQGEAAMADLFVGDRAEFDRTCEAGRLFIHGPFP